MCSRKSLGVLLASWVSRDFLSSDSQLRADAVSSVGSVGVAWVNTQRLGR